MKLTQEEKNQKQIEVLELNRIAQLTNEGLSQRQIGEIIYLSQQAVSYRLGIIKKKYPELLH